MTGLAAIRIRSRRVSHVRELLGMAGLRGPWAADPLGGRLLDVDESGPLTVLRVTSSGHQPAAEPEPNRTMGREISTVVVHRDLVAGPPLVFPLREMPQRDVGPASGTDAMKVLVAREGGLLARAHRPDGVPTLVLGFRLSDLATQFLDHHRFHGAGHLALVLEWFLDRFARVPWARVSPWRDGRPPLLVSFDVEAGTPRRSVGGRILRIGGLELNRLRLPRPLRGRRLVIGTNLLRDVDGEHRSHRATLDLRRARPGCAAPSHEVVQWQLHRWRGSRPSVRPSHDPNFRSFASSTCGPHTNFYCGGVPDDRCEHEEAGFHGTDHTHFHRMSPSRLARELADGRRDVQGTSSVDVIRAPGLCWSPDYFAALGPAGWRVDSSFREVNDRQPIVPIRTSAGWWELPVQGNIMHREPAIPAGGLLDDSMVNLYAHDHDLDTEGDRAVLERRIAAVRATGRVSMGLGELGAWLEASRSNELRSVRWQGHDAIVEGDLASGSVVEIRGTRADADQGSA
ncbi:MAG: hypothetical protein VX726_06680 [Planctomycetota bacterium]|nr:hypothetical protein [Planctomycetota bacterium]MEE2895415.1 hypothetical protein [Planctomycetota bacterium]